MWVQNTQCVTIIMRFQLQVTRICIATVGTLLHNQHLLYNIYLICYTILICYVFFSTITHAKISVLK